LVGLDEAVGAWTVLITGVITQQLSNTPTKPFETGTFTCLLPALVTMYLARYGREGED
jgi:hypothetical protein